MKDYKAILFDMDGTLLPMDMDAFTTGYFKLLYKKIAGYGLEAKDFGKNMWTGVRAMIENDGSRKNEEAFWEKLKELTGITQVTDIKADCLDFYANEFDEARQFTADNPLAKQAVELARSRAKYVVLATNPFFPMAGQRMRLSWLGLVPEDFDLVTAYETDSFCKPNPNYFLSVCERIGVDPGDCLMIGNDEHEDMYAADAVGIDCFLVTDCVIPSKEHPWKGPKGSFKDLIAMLK